MVSGYTCGNRAGTGAVILNSVHWENQAMNLLRIAAFADAGRGGNPAGVLISDRFPAEDEMRRIATEVGYSETAFAMPQGDAWRVRYFSPASEVPFCGHATIALGAALALAHGNGVYRLILNSAEITVAGESGVDKISAALQSPPTRSEPMSPGLLAEVLELFGYTDDDLDPEVPPARIHGGADQPAGDIGSPDRKSDSCS
jgi:PhzF family phenazine biosynthesis protein